MHLLEEDQSFHEACGAARFERPFFCTFKNTPCEISRHLLCRVAGINAQSETGVYQHGEHSQLSFTSLSDPQAISGLNMYDVCAMRIIRVISQLKTCQLTGFHRLFTGTQLNPFFQAHLYFTNLTMVTHIFPDPKNVIKLHPFNII